MPFTDLDTSTVDCERAAIFVAEFFVWWLQAGRVWYSRHAHQEDGGLQAFANDSVKALGGWQAARRLLRELDRTKILIEAKGAL